MKYLTFLSFLAYVTLFLITISAAFPSTSTDNESLVNPLVKRNQQCHCSFAIANFKSGRVRGVITFSQDERGHTEVAGIFKSGFEDKNATYGVQIVDECHNVLFDLTKGLCVKLDNHGGTEAFRHKFDNMSVDCNSNGILTKKVHHSKRNCNNNKLRKRLPNSARTTQNGQGTDYAGLEK